jgi:prephenate dehydrogenase
VTETIGIVGLGLIGGSFARALATLDPRPRVIAVELDEQVRVAAESIVAATSDAIAALAEFDIVALCTPIGAIESLLGPVSSVLRDGAILCDVGGVKGPVVARARTDVREAVSFVGCHPMFGGELGGFSASSADRFRGGVVAVCGDLAGPEAIARIVGLFESVGSRVIRCTADEHDAAVARISHLPYIAAHALVEAAEGDALAHALAGRGFAGATRLAGFSYEVQGEVARRNPHLPEQIDALIERLRAAGAALASPDDAARVLRAKR